MRQTVTLQRSQQVVDQLTAMLERTQQTLAAVVQQTAAKATAPPLLEPLIAKPPVPPLPAAWVYTPPPPKANIVSAEPLVRDVISAEPLVRNDISAETTVREVISAEALLSFESRPPWSTSLATSYDTTAPRVSPPTLVVRRMCTLLPAPRHSLDITESDAVPTEFLQPSPGKPFLRIIWLLRSRLDDLPLA